MVRDQAAESAALRRADENWAKAWEAKNVAEVLASFAHDAVMLAAGSAPLTGKKAIHGLLSEAFAVPGLSTRIRVIHAEVSKAGDLGYTLATYESTARDASGRAMSHKGKYVALWRRQVNGDWQVIVHSSSPH